MRKMILAAIAISLPTLAIADAATDAVEARQAHMKSYGKQMATFAGMAKGEIAYDAEVAQAAADMMAELARKDQSEFWLPGTSSEDMPGVSYAKPAFWSEMDNASAIGADLVAATDVMSEAAGKSQQDLAKALGGIGKNCQACHKAYQVKKD